jgi:hypothetical protein
MNRDDIIRMSDESGLLPTNWGATENQWRSLERFAALVAAAEREACANILMDMAERDSFSNYYLHAALLIRERGQA